MRSAQPRFGMRCGSALLVLLAATAGAQTIDRVPGSLKDRPTVFAPAADAPQTVLRRADVSGALATRSPSSRFGPASGPATVFRAAEVAPARVEITRELLATLKARQTEQQAIVVDLPADVLFDFDRFELRSDARMPLDKAAELLRSYPGAQVVINGHTDGKGSDAYNDALSLRRAQAVAERLGGDAQRRFEVHGHGRRMPVAPETTADGRDDPAGRQLNRRVEIVIQPVATASR